MVFSFLVYINSVGPGLNLDICNHYTIYCTFKVKLSFNSTGTTHAHKTGLTQNALKITYLHILNSQCSSYR